MFSSQKRIALIQQLIADGKIETSNHRDGEFTISVYLPNRLVLDFGCNVRTGDIANGYLDSVNDGGDYYSNCNSSNTPITRQVLARIDNVISRI